jgi:hypothetical protein
VGPFDLIVDPFAGWVVSGRKVEILATVKHLNFEASKRPATTHRKWTTLTLHLIAYKESTFLIACTWCFASSKK